LSKEKLWLSCISERNRLLLCKKMAPSAFRCNDALYQKYYSQTGQGNIPVFRGELYQSGYGIGGLLSGLFRSIIPMLGRTVKPLLKTGARALGKAALRAGKQVLKDSGTGKQTLKQSVRQAAKKELARLGKQGVSHVIEHFQTKKRKLPAPKKSKVKRKKRKADIFDK
jgi:hypothetical protein